VESAFGLMILLLFAAAGIALVTAVGAQLKCVDAARDGARAVARGESADAVRRLAGAAGPPDAEVSIARDADSARVAVSARVGGLARLVPVVRVHAQSVAALEPAGDEDL
jgi:Flp pilus assembly protein TadG